VRRPGLVGRPIGRPTFSNLLYVSAPRHLPKEIIRRRRTIRRRLFYEWLDQWLYFFQHVGGELGVRHLDALVT